ncbi:hypothetical protein LINGRAHAP2_LOCUS7070 [Linum grandiflorum]
MLCPVWRVLAVYQGGALSDSSYWMDHTISSYDLESSDQGIKASSVRLMKPSVFNNKMQLTFYLSNVFHLLFVYQVTLFYLPSS